MDKQQKVEQNLNSNTLSLNEKLDLIIKQQHLITIMLGEANFYGVSEKRQKILKLNYKKLTKIDWKLLENKRRENIKTTDEEKEKI